MENYKNNIVELNESNKKIILDFVSENVLNYYGEPWAIRTEEIREKSKKTLIENYEKDLEKNRLRLFAYIIEDTVLGTIAIKDNFYAQLVFVKKEVQRMGIGTSLVNHVQNIYDNLSVLAVKSAIPFFEQNGFFLTEDIMEDSIEETIENAYDMEYYKKSKEQRDSGVRK